MLESGEQFDVPMIKKEKFKKVNPKTNRLKTSRKTKYLTTDVEPKNRTFKNLPRYADGSVKVKFQDWLMIKPEGGDKTRPHYYGKSDADGKWYGWSHRAVYGFKEGDVIKPDTIGNEGGKQFTLSSEKEAREFAIRFAKEVS